MWLTIIMALLSYFITYRASGGDKSKAAAAALVGGLATGYAVSNTEWGKSTAESFNSTIGITSDPLLKDKLAAGVATGQAGGVKLDTGAPPAGTSAWDVLKTWGSSGTALVAGTVAGGVAVATGKTNWLLYGALGLGAYALLK